MCMFWVLNDFVQVLTCTNVVSLQRYYARLYNKEWMQSKGILSYMCLSIYNHIVKLYQ